MLPLILRLDVSGQPVNWLPWQEAVMMYTRERVCWTAGEKIIRIRGGFNRMTGLQSILEVNSIIAVKGRAKVNFFNAVPPLNNRELFRRDGHMCMYCGQSFNDRELTRDHVVPSSRGGKNAWTNVVTACKPCNNRKGNRMLADTGMELLALPYAPNYAEYLALVNSRRILGDQMDFLKHQFHANSRLRLM